jgi:hypothetical protein
VLHQIQVQLAVLVPQAPPASLDLPRTLEQQDHLEQQARLVGQAPLV